MVYLTNYIYYVYKPWFTTHFPSTKTHHFSGRLTHFQTIRAVSVVSSKVDFFPTSCDFFGMAQLETIAAII
jgi:hypothetical protein